MKHQNYLWLWILIPALILTSACEKAETMELQDEIVEIALEKSTKSANQSRPANMQTKMHMIIKKSWVFSAVFHDDPEIQEMLESILVDMQLDFTVCDNYRIVIPAINRDDTGRWKFNEDGTRITFDEGTESEHFIDILELTFRNFRYTYDDPDLGRWELHLVPYYHRWHGELVKAKCF